MTLESICQLSGSLNRSYQNNYDVISHITTIDLTVYNLYDCSYFPVPNLSISVGV